MKEVELRVPGYKTLILHHLVLDFNGTLAKDGQLIEQTHILLDALIQKYKVHVITSDTFGTVAAQLKDFDLEIKVLSSDEHTEEKEAYVDALGCEYCVAIGNGNNDRKMLKKAALGIALVADEGCSVQTLTSSDIVCKTIEDALGLLLHEKRLIATLRQ